VLPPTIGRFKFSCATLPVGALVTPPIQPPLSGLAASALPPRRGRCHAGLVFFWGSAYLDHMLSTFDFCLPTDTRSPSLDDALASQPVSMETKMRRRVLTVLGVLLMAILTIQTATAAARNARKSVRAPVPVIQQLRERQGLYAPAGVPSRSCDRFWCYEDGAPVSPSHK
jgi:hypothetical protein